MKRLLLACALILMQGAAHAADRLRCGVIVEPLDWNKTDLHGSLVPLATEICRAVATARFGAPDRLDIQSYDTEDNGLIGLHTGKSDMVAGLTPDVLAGQRNAVRYSLPFFYDAQGFMVHKAEGVRSVADIAGHKLCTIEDTDNSAIALAYLAAHGIRPVPFGFQEEGEMDAAIMDRHCQVTSAMLTKLAEARASFHNRQDYVLLPTLLTLSPVAVATDAHDLRLSGIVDTTISVLLQAEFLGVTRASAPSAPRSDDPRMQRLLGEDYATGLALDLPHDWSRVLIATLGNYGEIYARTVGPGTELDLPRGLNALWNQGGLMAPLPLH
jgi:general L-amino acid transport system substrate-binding protein